MKPANDNKLESHANDNEPRIGPAALVLVGLIRVYRYTLSAVVGRTCRFLPTCSEYGEAAVRRHGAWRGGWLTVFRLVRCRPGARHGYDPVPEHVEDHGWRVWRYRRQHPAQDQ